MKQEKVIGRGAALRGDAHGIPALLSRIAKSLLAFLLSLVTAGCALFPGSYIFGIAATASLSRLEYVIPAYIGSLIGCAFISAGNAAAGGVYAMTLTLTLLMRFIISLWVADTSSSPRSAESGEAAGGTSEGGRLRGKRITGGGMKSTASPNRVGRMNASNIRSPSESEVNGTVLRGEIPQILSRIASYFTERGIFGENIRLRMVLSSAAALISGAWSVVSGGYLYYDLFSAVFSILFAPVCTYLCYAATEKNMRVSVWREAGVFSLIAAAAFSLHSFATDGILGFDPGIFFALLSSAVLSQTYSSSPAFTDGARYRGLVCALVTGAVIDPVCIPAFAAAAYVSSFYKKLPVYLVSAVMCALPSAWGVLTGGIGGFAELFPPSFAAACVMLPIVKSGVRLIPLHVFGYEWSGDTSSAAKGAEELHDSEYVRRMKNLGDSIGETSSLVRSVGERLRKVRPDELSGAVSETFERYCGLCRRREQCKKGAECAKNAMKASLISSGEVSAAAVPASVATVCPSVGRMIDEINHAVSVMSAGVREGDMLLSSAEDMASLSGLIKEVEKKIDGEFTENKTESARLARLLGYNNISAHGVRVLGEDRRRVMVSSIELSQTRLGGDDIAALVGEILGGSFSAPQFSINGPQVSMYLESKERFSVTSGSFSVAASGVRVYDGKDRLSDADEGGAVDIKLHGARCGGSDPDRGISGDGVTDFESAGRKYMILSDGMGTGREASVASGMALGVLKRCIEGGAELESALGVLNKLLRATGRECPATVDVCEIDLYSGRARFVKSGAAPSFVLRGGSIFRLQSKTVPIGIIRALDAEMIKFDVEEGDTVVMISDGVARSYEEAPWLIDMLSSDETVRGGDEERAAMTIVSEAAVRGSTDDITCGVMRIGA